MEKELIMKALQYYADVSWNQIKVEEIRELLNEIELGVKEIKVESI